MFQIDLSLYKETQMKRRLTSFRHRKGFANFNELYNKLLMDEQLQAEFLDRLTINVTDFFRNYNRWRVLETRILPKLIAQKPYLRVWSAACSTGEEPYTLAMILSNLLPKNNFSILATDIDQVALCKAKEGLYVERSLKEVPSDYKNRYFTKIDNKYYAIHSALKDTITFRHENLLAHNHHSDMDLIVCRNVMIYFTEEAKEQLFLMFNRTLTKNGILFVGSTEQIFQPKKYGFHTEDTFFYRKL